MFGYCPSGDRIVVVSLYVFSFSVPKDLLSRVASEYGPSGGRIVVVSLFSLYVFSFSVPKDLLSSVVCLDIARLVVGLLLSACSASMCFPSQCPRTYSAVLCVWIRPVWWLDCCCQPVQPLCVFLLCAQGITQTCCVSGYGPSGGRIVVVSLFSLYVFSFSVPKNLLSNVVCLDIARLVVGLLLSAFSASMCFPSQCPRTYSAVLCVWIRPVWWLDCCCQPVQPLCVFLLCAQGITQTCCVSGYGPSGGRIVVVSLFKLLSGVIVWILMSGFSSNN